MAVTLTILFTLLSLLSTASCRTMVGEITAIADVKENREVQELGKFAVEKYNEGLRLWKNVNVNVNVNDDGGEEKLEFGEVVEAQQQVVSGMKYYMEILAMQNGVQKMFTSVVVVKPWLHSKKVLNFGPSSTSSSSSQ